jgi:hypothetical protein
MMLDNGQPPSTNLSRTSSLLPMAPATLLKKVWAGYTLSLSLMANFYLFSGVNLGPLPLPINLFPRPTPPAQSPTSTWNWPPPLPNSMSLPNPSMFVLTQCTTSQTTLPLSPGRRRGPPHHRAPSRISSISMHFISITTATSQFMTSSLVSPMFWQISALAIFISLIPNFCPILMPLFLRQCHGACATFEKRRFPH